MTFVPVRSLDAIRRCQTNLIEWNAAFGQDDRAMAYVFCRETIETDSAFHTRMFAPRLGVPEDPSDGQRELLLEQGYEMGRPSLIGLSLTVRDRRLAAAAISGEAVVVSEGMIEA